MPQLLKRYVTAVSLVVSAGRSVLNITSKTLLIVGTTFVLLMSVLAVVSKISVLSGFADIETENARIEGIRALNEINDDMAALSATVGDWAPWDDTYQFMEDLNHDYSDRNLTEVTLTNIRVNFMIFIDNSGQIRFTSFVNPDTGKMESAPAGLASNILAIPNLMHPKELTSGWSGMMKTDQGPVITASRPIVRSDLTGPARGSLVMGRYFDDKELQRINQKIKLNIQIYDWVDPSLPVDCRTAQPMLSQADPIYIQPLEADLIATYLRLTDFSGRPVIMLKISADRKIYQTGLKTWWYYVASMIAIGLFFTFLIMAVLHRIVLAPLSRLNSKVQSISNTRDFYIRLPVQTEDELGQLAVEINKMLEELTIAGQKLSEQSYQSGLSEMASDMLHQIRNSLSPITGNIDLMEKFLDQAGLKRIDQALAELETGTSPESRRDDLLHFARMAVRRLETLLMNIRAHLNHAREPMAGVETILQEYQLTAEIHPQIDPVNLTRLVKDALEKIEPAEDWTRQVILDTGLSGVGPALGNRVSLLNVVKTLLTTAAHFMKTAEDPNGEIHITANELSEKNQVMILLTMISMGKGLDSELLERMFERKFSNRQGGGPDTSLHWCANIVNAMGGSLRIKRKEKDQKLCFCLTLPKAKSPDVFEDKTGYGN